MPGGSSMRCLRYFGELRDQNQRVEVLLGLIDSYGRNKSHLEALNREFKESTERLAYLTAQWDFEYLPAIERARNARTQLEMAKNAPEEFHQMMQQTMQQLTLPEIEKQIGDWQNKVAMHALNMPQDADASKSVRRSDVIKCLHEPHSLCQPAASSAMLKKASNGPNSSKRKRPSYEWSLSAVSRHVEELERKHKELSRSLGRIGSRSCALTVQLKAIQDKIEELQEATKYPASKVYESVEAMLARYQIETCDLYLKKTLDSRKLSAAHAHCRESSGQATLSGVQSFFIRDQNSLPGGTASSAHARERSDATTVMSTPSWADSVASSMTEMSLIGDDFLCHKDGRNNFEHLRRWL